MIGYGYGPFGLIPFDALMEPETGATKLDWSDVTARTVQYGVDRGILYPEEPYKILDQVEINLFPNPLFDRTIHALYRDNYFWSSAEAFPSTIPEDPPAGEDNMLYFPSYIESPVPFYLSALLRDTGLTYLLAKKTFSASFQILTPYSTVTAQMVALHSEESSHVPYGDVVTISPSNDIQEISVIPNEDYPDINGLENIGVLFTVTDVDLPEGEVLPDPSLGIAHMLISPTAEPPEFFTGSGGAGEYYIYDWDRDYNFSASRAFSVESSAVPWQGLISFDESMNNEIKEYYFEGRPYLFVPSLSRYSGTINAYTYPDEFLKMVGNGEVAGGLYFDGQQPQTFGLTYRTKIANTHEGLEAGYILHLVYNLTATQGDTTRETLADSINPTTFTWDVQAVPVQVEGFLPTAHVMIDSRKIDASDLSNIEEILYGSNYRIPRLPAPSELYELLTFGNLISVMDLYNGTVEITGNSQYVIDHGDGTFTLRQIDGENLGDGSFRINTTYL